MVAALFSGSAALGVWVLPCLVWPGLPGDTGPGLGLASAQTLMELEGCPFPALHSLVRVSTRARGLFSPGRLA